MKKYTRTCPKCNKELTHKHYVSFRDSLNKNRPCSKCSNKERANRPEERKKNSERQLGKRMGKDNSFYGKKHTESTKEIIRQRRKNQIIPKGVDNPLYGKRLEDIVGVDRAAEIKRKKSERYMGSGNPMYGRPAPVGSGNGWSGWYDGWFFRSILELSYRIKVIDRYNMKWESGESSKYKIQYVDENGIERNYFPDFIINEKYMVEIKPPRLHNSHTVLLKTNAATEYCNNNNMTYKITSVAPLTTNEIKELIKNKKVILTERYQAKYEKTFGD